MSRDHQATAYVVDPHTSTGWVIPIRTATSKALRPIRTGNGDTNTALPEIRTGRDPKAIAITPDGRTAYVVNSGSGTVTPIRVATNTALRPIHVGGYPGAIAIVATPR